MRSLFWKAPLLLAFLVVLAHPALADEVIYFKDTKGISHADGTIKSASPTAIVLANGKRFESATVVDVLYLVGDADAKNEYRKIKAAEDKLKGDKKGLKDMRSQYEALKPKLASNKAAVSHMDYKIGMISAALAEEDKAERKPAIDSLSKFATANPEGWQIVSALNTLAKLYSDEGAFDKAAETYDALKKVPGVTAQVKQDCDASVVHLLLKSGQHQKAAARIDELLKTLQSTDPQFKRLEMMRYTCQAKDPAQLKTVIAKLKEEITKTNDKNQLALAYNTLGDCFLQNDQPEDAMWQYLFVDTLYNQDKTEHLKAMKQLVEVFKKVNRMDKSTEYAERVEKASN